MQYKYGKEKKYCIRLPDATPRLVKGQKVEIPEYQYMNTFIHHPIGRDGNIIEKYWNISDVKTGADICSFKYTSDYAKSKYKTIENCAKRLKVVGVTKSMYKEAQRRALSILGNGECKIDDDKVREKRTTKKRKKRQQKVCIPTCRTKSGRFKSSCEKPKKICFIRERDKQGKFI